MHRSITSDYRVIILIIETTVLTRLFCLKAHNSCLFYKAFGYLESDERCYIEAGKK